MGNCFTCFKEPNSEALDNSNQPYNKEEMPEVRLYPAPSHHVPVSAPSEAILSNGNHMLVSPETNSASIARFYPCTRKQFTTPVMGVSESKASDTKLNLLFDQYKDDQEDCILAEGIEQLCKDLQVAPEDIKVLILAWKLNAEQMCRFTRSEFVNGLKSIRADSIKTIQTRLPELVTEVERSAELFKDLYRFTFRFGLDAASGQRILPTEMAIVLWQVVFNVREPPILKRWLGFLESHPSIRGIPRDTWNMFLNFSEAVGSDLSCYDDTEAWPSLFDDFVEHENDQANQNITRDKNCEVIINDNL